MNLIEENLSVVIISSVVATRVQIPGPAAPTHRFSMRVLSVLAKDTPQSTVRRRTHLPSSVASIITPYNADAFEHVLGIAGLADKYPILATSTRHGFTMGDLPPLLKTDAPPNSQSITEHVKVTNEWVGEELTLGRVEGPYSPREVEDRLTVLQQLSDIAAMKTTLLLLLAAISASVVASPTPDPLGALESRDKYCNLHDDVTPPGHCRSCASTSCSIVRDIKGSDRFGVNCWVNGQRVNNNPRWDWVPGWGCYVSASITNPSCENGVSEC
ncbi:hypothetical protein FS837_002581 [Tulasnella sp. UAMH 9824]|nr:hypothetical protein FS837_002581 [Tulasnella sp. UAMH 9824]